VDPANVEARATVLLVDGDQPVISQTIVFPYNDLDAPGQAQVDALEDYFEQRAADSY